MTPLGLETARDMLLPPKDRRLYPSGRDAEAVWQRFPSMQFFDVSAIVPAAKALAREIAAWGADERFARLPASHCWLEWVDRKGRRRAAVLDAPSDVDDARCWSIWKFPQQTIALEIMGVPLRPLPSSGPKHLERTVQFLELDGDGAEESPQFLLALLLIINTPRIIRRAHGVHRGFAKLAKKSVGPGHFPAGGWTEIVIGPASADDTAKDADGNGAMPYHHVRGHWKPRAQVWVDAYWKGDIAHGIKRSRYLVAA